MTVMLREPAIVARAAGGRPAALGEEVSVRVEGADPVRRSLDLVVV